MKKHFTRALLAMCALAFSVGVQAATDTNALIINRADGVKEYLALHTEFSIESTPEVIRLSRPEIVVEYAMGEVTDFRFGNYDFGESLYEGSHQASIDEISAPERAIGFDDNAITSSQSMQIFDLKGREVARGSRVETSSIPAGVYIVKVGSTTLKIKL